MLITLSHPSGDSPNLEPEYLPEAAQDIFIQVDVGAATPFQSI